MKSLRLLLLPAVGCCFLRSEPVSAQVTAPAYTFPKQYSSDVVVTTGQGQTMTMKTYRDSDKIRTEMTTNGMQLVSIIRPDQKKIYSVMVAQKMVMVMPFDPATAKQMMTPGVGSDMKVEMVGPEAAEGVAATKYKITNSDGKVIFIWVDPATSVPVKVAADDGSFSEVFKNFQVGPQDASLFDPPAGYQVMKMPSAPTAPPGAGQ